MKTLFKQLNLKSLSVTGLYSLILSFIFVTCIYGEDKEKLITQVYNVKSNTKLSIENKYGDIDIKDWEKKTIDIKIHIKVADASDKEAEEILNMINIDFRESGNEIFVETVFDESLSRIISRRSGINDKNFEIEYVVYMPKDVPLRIYNKYGSVFISENVASPNIEIKYGKLRANKILSIDKNNMTHVTLAYSDAAIEECSWLKLDLKYSKTNISTSKALIVISKYSKLFIEKGSSLVSESKYDSYQVGYLRNFVASAGYSNFRFNGISHKIALETKYTDVNIDLVPKDFESIEIENEYGGYKIGIASDASYKIKGHAKYAKINYPDNSRVNRFNENGEFRVEGYVGNESDKMASVKIETRYGGVNLNP